MNAYETWDAVRNVTINLTRVPDNQANPDFLDAINLNPDGTCSLFDGIIDPDWQGPYADIVFGGWLPEDYFSKCLGSGAIIAVTWTFTDPTDLNHDQYDDIQYVELRMRACERCSSRMTRCSASSGTCRRSEPRAPGASPPGAV